MPKGAPVPKLSASQWKTVQKRIGDAGKGKEKPVPSQVVQAEAQVFVQKVYKNKLSSVLKEVATLSSRLEKTEKLVLDLKKKRIHAAA